MQKTKNGARVFVIVLALWMVVLTTAVTVATWPNQRHRAVMGMAWGLILLWIFLAGTLMHRFREPIRKAVSNNCVPTDRKARAPRWWHYPLAVVVPFLFIPLVPLPLIAGWLYPGHSKIHFPPIGN